jgi:hypothetical protein
MSKSRVDYKKQAEQIISDSVRFVLSDVDTYELALAIQSVKTKHKDDIEELAKDLEEGVPSFIFKAMLTSALFDELLLDYAADHNIYDVGEN